jgi:hypothetical protein
MVTPTHCSISSNVQYVAFVGMFVEAEREATKKCVCVCLMCSECLITTNCSAVLTAPNVLMLNWCISSGFVALLDVE